MVLPLLLAVQSLAPPITGDELVVTASRVPEAKTETAASVMVIDAQRIERLGEPLAPALVRLTPSAAVETAGPAGSLTQVRIRGAEASHTLLFIDGIRANDPASGDIPRFELLNADLISRIEVVRGPQSALWGSDAIGGVVAVDGDAALEGGFSLSGEAGSFGFRRGSARGANVSDRVRIAGAVGWQRADGIDSFSGFGEREGYSNLSGRLRGSWSPATDVEIGASGFSLSGTSQFDGFDPVTFRRADTLDYSKNRLAAGRLWVSAGSSDEGLSGAVQTSLLKSSNRNFLGDDEINRTSGGRWALAGQAQYRFVTGALRHTAVLALDRTEEEFHARDTIYFGASNQDRRRAHEAVTAELRTEAGPLVADLALRHDRFSAFDDATTVRLSALVALGGGLSAAASYSEGIAQPTFFDLYGFLPGSFVGNPELRPETSRGYEASLRYRSGKLVAALTAYRQTLRDEIVDQFDPATFLSTTVNRAETSRRSGIEAELGWSIADSLTVSASYSYLHADEPGAVPDLRLREIRRPKHSGAVALDGRSGRFSYGASLAYSGARFDNDFDVFPARRVRLKPYWLAGVRIAYRVHGGLEIFARGSNLLDQSYQDVLGYRTEGRAIYAGISLSGD